MSKSGASSRNGASDDTTARVFDVGINERLPLSQLAVLGLQNVFGMTGMFVFPGILGRAFQLPDAQIAYLYGMTFMACGIITILQSIFLLRLPIAQGPYAGSFGALLAVGHMQAGGLGTAFGSFFAASLIWCALTVPIRGRSVAGLFARHLRVPLISGMIVMLIMVQIASVALPTWIGNRASPGFPGVNLFAGAVAVSGIVFAMLKGGRWVRRISILLGLALGTLAYTLFQPISFAAVAAAPLVVLPHIFPFGFGVRPDLVAVFLLVLIPAGMGSMALYQTVADWGGETLTPGRMSEGLFGVALGSVVAAMWGGFSTIAYPDNIGILRATRVGSRFVTLTAGIFLIMLGGCVKFDMLLVVVPIPVISAAATLLFGVVFMHGVHMLAQVEWDDRRLIATGLSFLIGLGGLFVSPDVMRAMPLMLQLVLQQPVISGGLTLVVLHALLCSTREASVTPSTATTRTQH
ncbi:xanthine/uracil permease [Burkholderia sp. THE68]|uniref:uracil-xanthine permease family protein n=1 Tax=Burkholderia sp. THE68 TaxID=758782 RepID=UPI001315EC6E|nr:solute carrier family 23 protein [Burkholderia sp. THE68]BBU30757.1 xanthine/uracil permease [Burkholderia sp. THE68]